MKGWLRSSLVCAALLLFAGGSYLANREQILGLENKLAETERELAQVQVEHRDTLDAINMAMAAREEVHAGAQFCERRLYEALVENQNLAELPLSDSIWMCLQWPDDKPTRDVDAPTGSAGGYRDPEPQGSEDGGRHGQADH